MIRTGRALTELATRVLVMSVAAFVTGAGGVTAVHAQQDPTVYLVPDGGTGVILTDPEGWMLYTWVGDRPGVSNCSDACSDDWPPYVVDDDEVLTPIGMPGQLGLLDRGDGTLQVTADGWPLYYFSGDGRPGDANGDEVVAYGSSWQVAAYPPRTPTSGQTPGVPVPPPDGPSPSFSAPPPPPGVEPTIIPIISPFNSPPRR